MSYAVKCSNGIEYRSGGTTDRVLASWPKNNAAWPIGAMISYFKTGDHEIPGNMIEANRPIAPATPQPVKNPLQVTYYSQRDSDDRYQAFRMCYSSSCAMLLNFLKPGLLHGYNGDDQYLGRVLRYGDTTDTNAQLQALAYYGLNASFRQNLTWKEIDEQLAKGHPVPIGILFQGPISAPTGGGHWIVVVGKTDAGYYIHDPYGELDLINGEYDTSDDKGAFLIYSKANLGARWMVGGELGWGIIA
jgi:uncharacterized protein YvpB